MDIIYIPIHTASRHKGDEFYALKAQNQNELQYGLFTCGVATSSYSFVIQMLSSP